MAKFLLPSCMIILLMMVGLPTVPAYGQAGQRFVSADAGNLRSGQESAAANSPVEPPSGTAGLSRNQEGAGRLELPTAGTDRRAAEDGESAEEDEIETDRDSFTPSAKVVGFRRTIFEASYTLIDNRSGFETHSFPELLIRHGLTKNLELRLGWNYEIGGGNSVITGNPQSPGHHAAEPEVGSHLLYGLKAFLSEQNGLRPESSVIIQGATPTSGESNFTNFSVTPVMGWTTEKGRIWGIANRFQTSEDEGDHFNIWSPSTVFKVPLGERMRGHIEYFGVFSDHRETASAQHFISPGIHHLLNRDLEIGWRAGWGLNEQSPNFFINFGIGRRF